MSLLTITEIARRIGRPDATVRYYRDQFEPWMSRLGEGHGRRYTEDDVEVLRVISDAMRAKVPADIIRQRLAEQFPTDAEAQQLSTATQPQSAAMVAEALRLIVADLLDEQRTAMIAELSSIGDQILALRGVANQIKASIGDELRQARETAASQGELIGGLVERNKALEAEVATLRKAQQQPPWWRILWARAFGG